MLYEVITKPWFGPRKRGKQLLLSILHPRNMLSCDDFIEFVAINFPHYFRSVQHIRFYTCTFVERTGEKWEQRFAVCSIAPDYSAREALFAQGPFITKATGWYPVIMGSRMFFRRSGGRQTVTKGTEIASEIFNADWGNLSALTGLNLNESGCSLLLDFTHNSLLLDCGFSYCLAGKSAPPGRHSHSHSSGSFRRSS